MQIHCACVRLVIFLAAVVGQFAVANAELTVSEAQRFHRLIKDIGPDNGLECHFSGFPVWKPRGLEPSVPDEIEWHFVIPPETKNGETTRLRRIVLRIRLTPAAKTRQKGFLFTWQKYDVIVASKTDIPLNGRGKTAALIRSLKKLGDSRG